MSRGTESHCIVVCPAGVVVVSAGDHKFIFFVANTTFKLGLIWQLSGFAPRSTVVVGLWHTLKFFSPSFSSTRSPFTV